MTQVPPILPFAITSCAALAGAVWCAAALFLVREQHAAARKRAEAEWAQREAVWGAALKSISEQVEDLTGKLRDCGAQIPRSRGALAGVGSFKTGLNMTRRAQALRMHRRGDQPDQIAAVLDIPRQEVDLLLKVHHIVLDNL